MSLKNKTSEREIQTTYKTGQSLRRAGVHILVLGFAKLDFRHLKICVGTCAGVSVGLRMTSFEAHKLKLHFPSIPSSISDSVIHSSDSL